MTKIKTKKPVIVNTYNIRPGEALGNFMKKTYIDKKGETIPFIRRDSEGNEIPEMSDSARLVFDSRSGTETKSIYDHESGTVTFTGYCESGKIKV